jgi:hypothetical protein
MVNMRSYRLLLVFLCILTFSLLSAQESNRQFTVYRHFDNQSGMQAFQMLIPQGWNFSGGINWLPRPFKIAEMQFSVRAQDGRAGLDWYPDYQHVWSNDQGVRSWYGQSMPVAQPMQAAEFLQHIVIPNYRGNVQNLQVIAVRPMPRVAEQVFQAMQRQAQVDQVYAQLIMGAHISFDVAQVDVTYSYQGQQYFESFKTRLIYTQTANQMITFWGPEELTSFWCVYEARHQMVPLYVTMASSMQVNPVFMRMIFQINLQMVRNQQQQIQSIGELSRYISQTSREISDIVSSAYQYKDEVFDKAHAGWSEYIRGIQTVRDGDITMEVPVGYDNIWRNGDRVILSNDPGYNPNINRQESGWGQMQIDR